MSDGHDELKHYGILRKSGRYPWGSGKNPYQRGMDFYARVNALKKEGLTDVEIARGFGMTTTDLRATTSIATNQIRAAEAAQALRLREKGMSVSAIGRRMGKNESAIRSLLDPAIASRKSVLETTTNMLRSEVDSKRYIDIGKGNESHLGISSDRLRTAVAILKDEGYREYYVDVEQLGTGHMTTVKVLGAPDTKFPDLAKDPSQIRTIAQYSEDGGKTYTKIEPPRSIESSRIQVRYGPDGGAEKDGLIEVRRGVDELDLGTSRYAQVRIAVDGTHYLKGMAVSVDDLPKGVDIIFNTNKKDSGNKLDSMKAVESDPDNPFGSQIKKQKKYVDANGKEQLTALNIVSDEGDWWEWSKTLSSQMLSKQPPSLAKQQLDLTQKIMREEYEEIKSLTNPTVKQELLRAFSDQADAAAVDLKAHGLPRTRNHVILPVPEMRDNEIYAPNFRNGEEVVLIRHPHGGIFEIPELRVNNRQPQARKLLGQARDAVAINHRVAEQLSGADFDGDTVLVIPNNGKSVKTSKPLQGLKNFDPQTAYPGYKGMRVMRNTQTEMGMISNLITDMSVSGAPMNEIARAVRHSMVVIDAEKHKLNYKQSFIDNGIAELKKKYQPDGGASTLISRASSRQDVPKRKPRSVLEGGPIDRETGEKVYTPTGESYTRTTTNKRTGVTTTREVFLTERSTKMAEVRDAHKLSSGTDIEKVYADHANKLKALANSARKEMVSTPNLKYSPSARKAYAPQVETLNASLNVAKRNAPLERQAQLIANSIVNAKREATPGMDRDQLKKVRTQALDEARARVGAKKTMIEISPKEWEAIQSGAVSHSALKEILVNTDLRTIKEYATPRTSVGMSPSKISRAKSMMAAGYTQAEIAEALGVSTSTIHAALK